MSNLTLFEKAKSLIGAQELSFSELAKIHGAVDFKREAMFALRALKANEFLLKVASENPESLKQAIIDVAACGLTLSPIHKLAYLVPRDGKVMLDPSFKGLAQLAIDSKSVKYANAELVYSKDKFTLRGRGQEPTHERDPFSEDRGDLIGAYCIAETHSGDFFVETMTKKEIHAIRDRSPGYKAFLSGKAKSSTWVSDEGEMFKKTVIRRASKSWPNTDTREDERFAKAINVSDEADTIDFNAAIAIEAPKEDKKEAKKAEILEKLVALGRSQEKFMGYLCGTTKREIKSLSDLSEMEMGEAIVFLNQLISKQPKKKEVSDVTE